MASFYIYLNEQQLGPYTEDQLRQMLSAGQLTGEHFVWQEGTPDWVALKTLNLSGGAPRLKLAPRAPESTAPNPAIAAQEARLKREEQKHQQMNHALARSAAFSTPLGFMDRIRNAWSLMGASFQVIRADKTLLLLPLCSTLCAFLVIVSFVVPAAIFIHLNPETFKSGPEGHVSVSAWYYLYLFAFYFCNYTVILFFNAALVVCASSHLMGQPCSVKEGLKVALSRLPQILGWAAISATVGLLLQMLENAARDRRMAFVLAIVRGILGLAWTVITYFVLPILIIERVGPIQAIKSSVQILKKTWGENLVGNAGFGIIFGLLNLPGIALLVIGVFLLMGAQGGAAGWSAFSLFVLLAVVYFVVMALAQAAMKVIYQTALYLYAHDGVAPQGFSQEALAGAFSPRQ